MTLSPPASLFCGYRQRPSNESHSPVSSLSCSHRPQVPSPSRSPHQELLGAYNPSTRFCLQSIRGLPVPYGWQFYKELTTCPPSPPCHLKTVATVTRPQGYITSVIKHFFQLPPVGIFFLSVQIRVPRPAWRRSTRLFSPFPISSPGHLPTKSPLVLQQSQKPSFKLTPQNPAHQLFKKAYTAMKFRHRVQYPQNNDFDIGFKALYLYSFLSYLNVPSLSLA